MIVKLIIKVIIMVFAYSTVYGEFKPWKSDVLVGDEINKVHNERPRESVNFGVTNGVQGGAYFMVRFFQIVISPQDGPNCRHVPVCSVYCRHAVKIHGALLGSFLAGDRLLRCNPFYPPEKLDVPARVFK